MEIGLATLGLGGPMTRVLASAIEGDLQRALAREAPSMESPDAIRHLRLARGQTQVAFARTLKVSVYTFRNWEYGKRKPPSAVRAYLALIARAPGLEGTDV
jgi:DNA-binding transcriptional regulator YiaG